MPGGGGPPFPICTAWQLRGSEPNDHQDAEYDGLVVATLLSLYERAVPIVAGLAEAAPWMGDYEVRLEAAATRVEGGEQRAFTGMMCDSYHEVWMELHADLLLTLGIDRDTEGSY